MIRLSYFQLLLSNLFIIYLATVQNWDIQEIIFTFWIQSVIIGIFQFWRLVTLPSFGTQSIKIGRIILRPNLGGESKPLAALVLLFPYIFAHFLYLFFIFSFPTYPSSLFKFETPPTSSFSYSVLIIPTLVYFINHLISFLTNPSPTHLSETQFGSLVARPYLRIIPMHLTIIFGMYLGLPRLLFLLTRAGVDLYSHISEHRFANS
jgi:hypothetical protein